MRATKSVKERREALARAARQAAIPMPDDRPRLILAEQPQPTYIAISEWGYDVHDIPAAAIRLAQDRVPAKSKERQLLVYETMDRELEPTGWHDGPAWPNGTNEEDGPKVRLVGLTTTHRLFVQTPRLTYRPLPKEKEANDEEA